MLMLRRRLSSHLRLSSILCFFLFFFSVFLPASFSFEFSSFSKFVNAHRNANPVEVRALNPFKSVPFTAALITKIHEARLRRRDPKPVISSDPFSTFWFFCVQETTRPLPSSLFFSAAWSNHSKSEKYFQQKSLLTSLR